MKKRRDGLPNRESLSRSIIKNLIHVPVFRESEHVLFYVSFGSEVETHELLQTSFAQKKVYVPFVEDDAIHVARLDEWAKLQAGAFNVLEPHPREAADLSLLQLILVPGLAFDLRGYRMGYGHGYYDIFLKKTGAHTIGLAFEDQIHERLPVESHDVPVHTIVTDRRVIACEQTRSSK